MYTYVVTFHDKTKKVYQAENVDKLFQFITDEMTEKKKKFRVVSIIREVR